MASKSETGHVPNVANFRILVEHCTMQGATYNPGNPAIGLPALQTKLAEAEQALADHLVVESTYDSVTNIRETMFHELQVFTTRIMGTLVSFDVPPLTLADARTFVRKLRGQRAPKKQTSAAPAAPVNPGETAPAAVPPTVRTISAIQRSYDQQLQHFSKLVQLIQGEPLYQPNEPELTAAGLQAHRTVLANATAQVSAQTAGYKASLGQRNDILYGAHTGLPALARAVKAYVKAVYGPHSPQYLAIKGIQFRSKP